VTESSGLALSHAKAMIAEPSTKVNAIAIRPVTPSAKDPSRGMTFTNVESGPITKVKLINIISNPIPRRIHVNRLLASNSSLKIHRIYTQFSADGEEEYHVVPTMSVGVGYEKQKGDLSESQPFVSVGVGFRYNVSNNFNFLLGTKALWKTSTRDVNFHTTFGVGYLLGEEPVNNSESEVVTIPKEVVNIKQEFNPQEVSQVVQVPTEVTLASDNKSVAVSQIPQQTTVVNVTPSIQSVQQNITPPPAQVQVQPLQTKVVSRPAIQSGYFIQVAAYTKNQPTSLLTRLSKSGNHVVLRHNGSITKALVGPYSSERSARAALRKVKRVARGAFLVH